jgi:uncharacterized membrane protein YcaP (DUF421 family)
MVEDGAQHDWPNYGRGSGGRGAIDPPVPPRAVAPVRPPPAGQLTVIDLVVVLLLGSAVETAMIHGDVSLPAGFASAGTLMLMNRLLTAVFLRSERFCDLVGGGPALLVHDGSPVEEHLRRVGMTHTDLEEALRARGYHSPADVREAILETDGSVSFIPRTAPAPEPGEQAPGA